MPGKWTVCWARGCDFFVIVLKRSHKLSCDIPQFLRLGTTTNCATLQFSSPWIKYERRPVHRLTRAQTLPGSTLVLPVLTIMVWQSIVICLKQVARGSLQKECKCHGVTGSCNLKTCWKQLAPFAVVGSALKQEYLAAVPVSFKNNKIHEKHSRDSVLSRKSKQLVYLDSSPDYCVRNTTAGSLGMLGRTCTSDAGHTKKCRSLCQSCNLRAHTKDHYTQVKCRCK